MNDRPRMFGRDQNEVEALIHSGMLMGVDVTDLVCVYILVKAHLLNDDRGRWN